MASIYVEAGRIVEEVRSRRRGLKDALYATDSQVPLQKLKALVCKTLDQGDALQSALDGVDSVGTPGVALCMLHDLLLSDKKKIIGGGSLKRLLLDNRVLLQQSFKGTVSTSSPSSPTYLRVNTLRSTSIDLSHMQHECDAVVPNCIKVQPLPESKFDWKRDLAPLVNSGAVAVHDRASQLAAHAAFKGNTGEVIMEVCAAPGSKTTHLIAMASPSVRKIIAVEKDPKRCRTLLKRLELLCGPLRDTKTKCQFTDGQVQRCTRFFTCNNIEVVVRCEDFLHTTCSDYQEATVVVLDPSCSGSGLQEHRNIISNERIAALTPFQCKMLSKVLSLSRVHTVCYSTCSIYREENEGVVEQCIKDTEWEVTDPLPFTWPDPEEYTGLDARCVHAKPAVHNCRGFFLARLTRPPRGVDEIKTENRAGGERKMGKKRKPKTAKVLQQSSKKRRGIIIRVNRV